MSPSEHHERLWRELPEDLEPVAESLRLRFLLEHVRAGDRVLDLGCGEGRFAAELMRAGASVVAADVAAEPLRRARRRCPQLELALLEPDVPWPLADASFDAVWAGEVIGHVADTAAWLSEARRVLRSGGLLLLSTPDHGPLTRLRMGISPGAFAARLDPLGEHLRFYTRASLSRLIARFGFQQVYVRGAGGLPGARALLLARGVRSRF